MTPIEIGQAILDVLNRGDEVRVTFTKKDGSETTRSFCRDKDFVPNGPRLTEDTKYLNLWSIDDAGYRTIILESIKMVAC